MLSSLKLIFILPLQFLRLQELSDSSFPLTKHILSACVLDENRILLGAEDGLYTVDLRYTSNCLRIH